MLREHNVPPFASWDAELPKFSGDIRFKAISKPQFRRRLFDDFVKHRAEELLAEKASKKKVCDKKKQQKIDNISNFVFFFKIF